MYNEPSLFVMCIAFKLQNIFFKYVYAYELGTTELGGHVIHSTLELSN